MSSTPDLIERLAREAGFDTSNFEGSGCILAPPDDGTLCDCLHEPLRRFAALVAEECAKLVDAQRLNVTILYSDPLQSGAARSAADAIRLKFEAGDLGALAAAVRAKLKEQSNG